MHIAHEPSSESPVVSNNYVHLHVLRVPFQSCELTWYGARSCELGPFVHVSLGHYLDLVRFEPQVRVPAHFGLLQHRLLHLSKQVGV